MNRNKAPPVLLWALFCKWRNSCFLEEKTQRPFRGEWHFPKGPGHASAVPVFLVVIRHRISSPRAWSNRLVWDLTGSGVVFFVFHAILRYFPPVLERKGSRLRSEIPSERAECDSLSSLRAEESSFPTKLWVCLHNPDPTAVRRLSCPEAQICHCLEKGRFWRCRCASTC